MNILQYFKEQRPGILHQHGYSFEEISNHVLCIQKAVELDGNWWGMWERDYTLEAGGYGYKNPEPLEAKILNAEKDAWIEQAKRVIARTDRAWAEEWVMYGEIEGELWFNANIRVAREYLTSI